MQHWQALLPETHPRTVVTVRAGECAVTVRTDDGTTLRWLDQYLDGFWEMRPGAARDPATEVVAVAEPQARQRLCASLAEPGVGEPVTTFMEAAGLRRVLPGPVVLAGCPGHRVAYARDHKRVLVLADDGDALRLATLRVVRSAVTGWLEARHWAHVHMAAATRDGAALAAMGPKGAGKTAVIVALAVHAGWQVLAHDRTLLTAGTTSSRLLPWPSSLNIGLGTLNALGWADVIRAKYRDGECPPYHQRDEVTVALLEGGQGAVRAGEGGAELKAQLLPAQVADWFGISFCSSATLAALVFPRVDLTRSQPLVEPVQRDFTGEDVFPPLAGPDYFPDFLGLTKQAPGARNRAALASLRAVSAGVPTYRIVLGTDLAANARALACLV